MPLHGVWDTHAYQKSYRLLEVFVQPQTFGSFQSRNGKRHFKSDSVWERGECQRSCLALIAVVAPFKQLQNGTVKAQRNGHPKQWEIAKGEQIQEQPIWCFWQRYRYSSSAEMGVNNFFVKQETSCFALYRSEDKLCVWFWTTVWKYLPAQAVRSIEIR